MSNYDYFYSWPMHRFVGTFWIQHFTE